jgi:ABC-2 type transport system permease protein
MTRTWHVFWREYWGHITRRSYLLFTFGFPIFLVVLPALGGVLLTLAVASAIPPADLRPVGVIDQAGLLGDMGDAPTDPVEMRSFATVEAARAALTAGTIQAFYLIPPDYWSTGQVKIIYDQPPTNEVDGAFRRWVGERVQARVSGEVLAQLDRETQIVHRNPSGERVFSANDLVVAVLVFGLAYFVQLGSSFTANYMFDSVASESWDRTLEIVLTSISPLQFLVGKVLSLMSVGLTQLALWGSFGLILILLASRQLGLDLAAYLIGWEHLGVLASVLFAAYIMSQLLAAAIGLLHVNSGSGPLFFNTLNWVAGLGWLYAIALVPRSPHTPLALAASLFPLTSPIVLMIRLIVAEVPGWQIVLSQGLLWGTNIACLFWLRYLLTTNLVASTSRFRLLPWLKDKLMAAVRTQHPSRQQAR